MPLQRRRDETGRAETVIGILITFLATQAGAREFGGYNSAEDCLGHAAGYWWAQAHRVTSTSACSSQGRDNSFYEGCLVYVEDPARGADEDDDGDDIE